MEICSFTLDEFEQSIVDLKAHRQTTFPDYRRVSPADIALDFRVYEAVIKPHFVDSWMEPVGPRCKSSLAWRAIQDNLTCEKDPEADHRQLLTEFIDQIRDYPVDERFAVTVDRCQPLIAQLSGIAHETSAVDALAMLAYFENDSLVFIERMLVGAERLQLADRRYLEVHRQDPHAAVFVEAVRAESEKTGILPTNRPYELAKGLIDLIFSAHLI